MQPLERSTMRSLIILLFFTNAVLTIPTIIEFHLKNGIVSRMDRPNETLAVLNITQNDGTSTVNYLFTRSQSSERFTSWGLDAKNEVITITHTLTDPAGELIDCFHFTDDTQWFGGPQLRYQHWPVQSMYFQEEPYVPTHPVNMALAERYWLSSKGIYIYVNETSPLFIDQNNYRDKHLCLIAKNKAPYQHRDRIELSYTIGVFPNPTTAHQHAVENYLGKPKGHPNKRMIQHPVWSTWARYKVNVTEKRVEAYADEIIAHNFKNSQIEIDDNWETCYGSAEFDPVKFPDVRALTKRLKSKGFRVTLWIHPFINRGCEPAYSTALNNSYFVKNLEGKVQMSWWQGADAATIDFTNSKAVAWWVARLKRLEDLGIDSFKFDAGEVSWLPQVAELNASPELQPGIFTQEYVRTLVDNFDDSIEVRVGWRSQDLPVFVRMIDKDTRWTWNNGLPTLITTLLQMNLNGYVHVLPDMIGGNGYLDGLNNGTEYPSKEMFIRWLQANVFMPSLQYSFVPWEYDDETIEICREYTELHANYTDEIINAMKQAIEKGTPVNPPIWWIDPLNPEAHKINDEYLLGENILVAPVTVEAAKRRNIYLPKGKWYDVNLRYTWEGPRWLTNYFAPLNVLPYFKRV
ncbi:myogenesis-regulating glycosidase-like [Temnothorax longispinosus]|uniref:myogenesis-regulating glycosidase-like n=1 Tax=Temnothorax longispinosus TaxID=300112 RepID=UPI003A9A05BD